ncbi:MAG: RNA polymerase I enhancer binding protein [Candelina mexicana]|nr:MAG: RNA polymerase I enhancer binding protein [Candelina mexicana]
MLKTRQATGLPELAMGQNSSQVAEGSVNGHDGELEILKMCYSRLLKSNLMTEEETVNGTPDAPIDWQEPPSQRSPVAHTDSEQAFDMEKERKRKRSKKREGARTVDPEQHSRVEQSARTLLEMKGAHELERTYSNEDDRAASSQILSETLVQASPELPESFGNGSALEAQKPRKARKEKKSRRSEKRKAADFDAADLAMMLVEDEPSGTNDDLVPSTHIYPDPHVQQYQYEPTSSIDSDVTLGRAPVASISANGKYLPATADSNHTIEPLSYTSHNANFASVQSQVPKVASQSKNAEKKRKSKSSYIASSPPQSAASLAVAANAANALIDPALTAHQGDIWVIPDSQADLTPGNNTQDSIETSSSTKQTTTKRKRRLPDVNGYQADSSRPLKRTKSSDGLKKSVAKEKAKMNPSGMKDSSTLGPFDDAEISLLADFMEKYRDYHDLSEHQLNEKVHMTGRGGGPRDGFWDEVSDVLPYRTRQSIMKVCRRRFHNYGKRGKWTPDEDELLEQAQNEKPNKWKEIGETIGRLPEDCRDRWRNYLKCGDKRKTDIWTEKEVIMLKDAVAECRESMRSAKAKQAKNPTIKEGFGSFSVGPNEEDDEDNDVDLINWSVVSEKMGNIRSRLQCLYKWKKLKHSEEVEIEKRQKEAEEDDKFSDPDHPVKPAKITWRTRRAKANFAKMLPGDKLEILRALAESSTYEEKNIPWRLLSSQSWRGQWSTIDRKEAFAQMKACIPGHERFSLQELVQMLIEILEELEPRDRHDLFYVAPEPSQEVEPASRKKRSKKQQNKEIERDGDDEMAAVNGGWLHPSRVTANSQARRPQHTASNSPVDEEMAQQMQLLRQA